MRPSHLGRGALNTLPAPCPLLVCGPRGPNYRGVIPTPSQGRVAKPWGPRKETGPPSGDPRPQSDCVGSSSGPLAPGRGGGRPRVTPSWSDRAGRSDRSGTAAETDAFCLHIVMWPPAVMRSSLCGKARNCSRGPAEPSGVLGGLRDHPSVPGAGATWQRAGVGLSPAGSSPAPGEGAHRTRAGN